MTRDCDAIVIGAGSGGLTAALALARAGQRVIVLEQHDRVGGYTQSFTRDGFLFSPGVHYVGCLGPNGTLRQIYEGLGIANDLEFFELNPDGYDHALIGGDRFDIPKGRSAYVARLKARFPDEAAGIEGYFDVVERMSNEVAAAIPLHGAWDAITLPLHMPTVARYGLRSQRRLLDHFVQDPLLRAILSIQAGDHGLAPSRAPAVLHASVVTYYLDGAWYPRGGAQAIAEAFAAGIRRHGGVVLLRSAVERILVEHGAVAGVRLRDGTEIRANVVVSNTDPGVTWGRLVPSEDVGPVLRRRIGRLRYSVSTLSVFLGVDMDLRAAGLDSGNDWVSRTTDGDAPYVFAAQPDLSRVSEIPGFFLNVTTLKDPMRRRDGRHTIEAMCLVSWDAFAQWQDTTPGHRPEAYRTLKRRLADRLLEAIEGVVPDVRRHVVFQAVATPLTNAYFLSATRGAIYGAEKSLRNLGPLAFPIRTHVEGLFQCGSSTLAAGILGVTNSGVVAAQEILGVSREEVLTATGQALRTYSAEDPATWPSATVAAGVTADGRPAL